MGDNELVRRSDDHLHRHCAGLPQGGLPASPRGLCRAKPGRRRIRTETASVTAKIHSELHAPHTAHHGTRNNPAMQPAARASVATIAIRTPATVQPVVLVPAGIGRSHGLSICRTA